MKLTMRKRTIKLTNTFKKCESCKSIAILPAIMWDKYTTYIIWLFWAVVIEIERERKVVDDNTMSL